MIFNCGVISTHYNCVCILVLITLKMATRVAETCRWLIYNKSYIRNFQCISWYFVDRASQYNLFFFISNLIHCFFRLRTISAILFPLYISGLTGPSSGGLNCTCSLWYPPPENGVVYDKRPRFQGENTIGFMYNLDLLMMGLWGLKHVEERG